MFMDFLMINVMFILMVSNMSTLIWEFSGNTLILNFINP